MNRFDSNAHSAGSSLKMFHHPGFGLLSPSLGFSVFIVRTVLKFEYAPADGSVSLFCRFAGC